VTAASTFADAPQRVYWEITRACGLACRHCRARASPFADPEELDTSEGVRLLRDLASVTPQPKVVLTGGDPLTRGDLFELVATARARSPEIPVFFVTSRPRLALRWRGWIGPAPRILGKPLDYAELVREIVLHIADRGAANDG